VPAPTAFSGPAFVSPDWLSLVQIVQIVQGTTSTVQTTSSSSDADTGLTATITPSSTSSRILVLVSQAGFRSYDVSGTGNSTVFGTLKLFRGTGQIVLMGDSAGNVGVTTVSLAYVDSPATVSATTYKTTYSTGATPAANDRTQVQYKSALSVMTLVELA
jgi:hypothetical protein